MHFWNTKALSEELCFYKLNQSEKQKYLVFLSGVAAVYIGLVLRGFFPINFISAVVVSLMLLAGYFIAIKKNQSRDGKELGLRLICLTPPLLLKVLVGMFVFWWWGHKFLPELSQAGWFILASWILFTGTYLKWFLAQITEISKPKVSWEAHRGI